MIRIGIIGVRGRMGRAIVRAACEAGDVKVVAGVASAASKEIGKDVAKRFGHGRITN